MTALTEVTAAARAAAAELVERSTTAQHLPALVEDDAVVRRVAALVRSEAPALDGEPQVEVERCRR